MPKRSKKAPATEKVLYVVLHGLITLVDLGKNGFRAFLLDMQKEHKYLLGNWLQELPIKRKTRARLYGVDSGTGTLDADLNAVVKHKLGGPNPNHRSVFAMLELPRPRKIHYMTRGTIAGGALSDPKGNLVKLPTRLSGLRILEYTLADENSVNLQGSGAPLWTCPALAPVKKQKIALLHVYDQPGAKVTGAHNLTEFNQSAAFLGASVTLKAPTGPANQIDPPDGFLPGETSCLFLRGKDVQDLLTRVRQQQQRIGGTVGGCGSEVCAGCDGDAGG